MGILPLGTGNDLARVLGWGKSFRRERMLAQIAKLDRARVAALDRWKTRGHLTLTPTLTLTLTLTLTRSSRACPTSTRST